MKIVVGLGNPGAQYAKTGHNIGFCVVDELARIYDGKFSKKSCKSLCCEVRIDGEKVLLVKPQTYMNLSGEAVLMLKQKYKDAKLLVLVDDIDTVQGKVKYRQNGSGGTHNGLRNIVQMIGSDFERLKFGIGKPQGDLKDFVLDNLDEDLRKQLVDQGVERVLQWLK